MTKKDLIKKILELGKELEKANGFDAIMIINDMEIEIDNYTKQLPMHDVGGQSEQLVICKKCGSSEMYQYTKTKDKCEDCGNIQDYCKWYLIKKGDEYFAEKEVILPYSEIKKKVLHRDFNGDVLSLGKDKEWAEQWIYDKNEIDGYL